MRVGTVVRFLILTNVVTIGLLLWVLAVRPERPAGTQIVTPASAPATDQRPSPMRGIVGRVVDVDGVGVEGTVALATSFESRVFSRLFATARAPDVPESRTEVVQLNARSDADGYFRFDGPLTIGSASSISAWPDGTEYEPGRSDRFSVGESGIVCNIVVPRTGRWLVHCAITVDGRGLNEPDVLECLFGPQPENASFLVSSKASGLWFLPKDHSHSRPLLIDRMSGDALFESTGKQPGSLSLVAFGAELAAWPVDDSKPTVNLMIADLAARMGTVAIHVVRENGASMGAVDVALTGGATSFGDGAAFTARRSVADADGIALFDTVVVGNYRVSVTAPGASACVADLSVTAGTTSGIDVLLRKPVAVTFDLSVPDGCAYPPAAQTLRAFDGEGHELPCASHFVDAGKCRALEVTDLPPGRCFVALLGNCREIDARDGLRLDWPLERRELLSFDVGPFADAAAGAMVACDATLLWRGLVPVEGPIACAMPVDAMGHFKSQLTAVPGEYELVVTIATGRSARQRVVIVKGVDREELVRLP